MRDVLRANPLRVGWNVHHVPAWNVGGGLTFGNAILSRHPLLEGASLPLP